MRSNPWGDKPHNSSMPWHFQSQGYGEVLTVQVIFALDLHLGSDFYILPWVTISLSFSLIWVWSRNRSSMYIFTARMSRSELSDADTSSSRSSIWLMSLDSHVCLSSHVSHGDWHVLWQVIEHCCSLGVRIVACLFNFLSSTPQQTAVLSARNLQSSSVHPHIFHLRWSTLNLVKLKGVEEDMRHRAVCGQ